MFSDVKSWWIFLCIFSVVNIFIWIASAVKFKHRKGVYSASAYKWRKVNLLFSGIYVSVCAYRSFFPRIDLERICLFDTTFSNIFIGRSITTIAELCFMAQCAILLHEIGKGFDNRFSMATAYILVPLIFIAEGFSWYAMLTTNYLGSVIEESLWASCGFLLILCIASLWPKINFSHRKYIFPILLFATGFVIFMVIVDIPMYISRWKLDTSMSTEYLSISQGFYNSIQRCTVNTSIDIWRNEIPWMSLYFTLAVWVSISIPLAPYYPTFKFTNKNKVSNQLPSYTRDINV